MGKREYYQANEDDPFEWDPALAKAEKFASIEDWKMIKAVAETRSKSFYEGVANREANKRKLVIYRENK